MAVTEQVQIPTSSNGRDVMFAVGVVFILAILFLPIPTIFIDFGLSISIALSVLILMVSLWIARPLDFSKSVTVGALKDKPTRSPILAGCSEPIRAFNSPFGVSTVTICVVPRYSVARTSPR